MYCITGDIVKFYSNYKWSITFKNSESLYGTPVTYRIQIHYNEKMYFKKFSKTPLCSRKRQ